jgi:hypothetical protein
MDLRSRCRFEGTAGLIFREQQLFHGMSKVKEI